ncbi:MAG TPA: GNAT family N-acetyltransferase [Propionibacteriaceae bacterium]
MDGLVIRPATEADGERCAEIYRPYVSNTAITFEVDPPTAAQMADRIADANALHAWLIAEDGDRTIGYAYAHPFAARPAYRWSCETSVYLEMGRRRTGAGRALYEALLDRMVERGYRIAMAGMALPNPASVGLHEALGFELVGTYRRVGWKNGAWHDVARVQKVLAADPGIPAEPH